jgi:hypothetical protein
VLGQRLHQKAQAPNALPLTGRDPELSALDAMWDRVRAGAPGFVTITGDAGIGKSALIGEFLARLGSESCNVMRLHCSPLAEQKALWPVADYLGDGHDGASPDFRTGKIKEIREILQRCDPELAGFAASFLGLANHGDGSAPANAGGFDAVLALCRAGSPAPMANRRCWSWKTPIAWTIRRVN